MNESSEAEANEVCVVDDDPSVLKSMHYLLASEGFKVRPFNKAGRFSGTRRHSSCTGRRDRHLDGWGNRFGSAGAPLRNLTED